MKIGALVVSTQQDDWEEVAALASPNVCVSFGVHPWFANERVFVGRVGERLRNFLSAHPLAGVGELDLIKCTHSVLGISRVRAGISFMHLTSSFE